MRKTFIRMLCERAREDERVCLAVGDLGYSVVEPFINEFPDRFVNAGVAEQGMLGMAAGWSLGEGKKVFVYSIANFPTLRCLEQIRNDVCLHNADVKVVAVGGGLTYGTAGASHHAVEDLAIMRALPGMTVCAPADAAETEVCVSKALDECGPMYLRLGRNNEPDVWRGETLPGVSDVHRYAGDGGEVVLCSTGTVACEAMAAQARLQELGVPCMAVGLPVLKPLDMSWLGTALTRARLVVAVEEHVRAGGLASLLAEWLAASGSGVPLLGIALPGCLPWVGKQGYLRTRCGLDAESIVEQVRASLDGAAS